MERRTSPPGRQKLKSYSPGPSHQLRAKSNTSGF